jgi:hypothetical protein
VVLVGGSTGFKKAGDPPTHGFLYVDTSNMRDTTSHTFAGITFNQNDGDDLDKAFDAVVNGGKYPDNVSYGGEGVFWFDLAENTSGTSLLAQQLLPPTIHALAFDAQGRLLVGTEGGIFRTNAFGLPYDFTSGAAPYDPFFGPGAGTGILWQIEPLVFPPAVYESGQVLVKFTSLNSNLQITDLTSVALDPTNRDTLYTSQLGSGTAVGLGPNNWVTSGLTNLSGTIADAARVRTGPLDPSAPAGAPTRVYRDWAYEDPLKAVGVEVSGAGGALGSFVNRSGGIIATGATAASTFLPPLSINSHTVVEAGKNQDELMYGTSLVYETDTNGFVWDDVVSSASRTALSLSGGVVTAVAFAPSTQEVLYAGTDRGEVFVDLHGGSDLWPLRNKGLPSAPVTGIAVDPGNPSVAYVTFSGPGIGHVWKTTDAGATWKNISGNLPAVDAYSLVADPRPFPNAPQGRLYVGTQVGVYVSYDGGKTWQRLGQGLPNVPVVDLQFSQNFEILAAATQGRGVFTISTDLNGPHVVTMTPSTPLSPPLTTVTVTFNSPVDPRSFTTDNLAAARATVVSGVLASSEYRAGLVTSYYTNFLLRTPSAAEVSAWVGQFARGLTQEQVIAQFVGGNEYFNLPAKGNGSNATWIGAVFQDLVGRAPTAAEAAQLTADLNAGQPRSQVALNDLLTTATYQSALVTAYYTQYLKRAPSSLELSRALIRFANGATDEQILSPILSSEEYYQNNGTVKAAGTGTAPSAVALADLNGDGIPDLVVANSGNDTVSIFVGQPNGVFSPKPVVLILPAGAAPQALFVGDLNGDGVPDIAVANTGLDHTGGDSVSVFVNNTTAGGPVTFGPRLDFNGGDNPVALAGADFNGDGLTDLAVLDGAPDAAGKYDVNLLVGGGAGVVFLPPVVIDTGFTTAPSGLAAGDLNGDTIPDLAVAGSGGLRILVNDSSGLFTITKPQVVSTLSTNSVAIGPVAGTSRNDIVATQPTGQVLVFQNQGGSPLTFSGPTSFAAGVHPQGVVLKDLNGDGKLDVVVVNKTNPGTVTVLRNTTQAATSGIAKVTFFPALSFPVGTNPTGLALADVNGDKVLDVATANSGSDNVSTLLGYNDGSFQMPSDQGFITQVYLDLLHRAPDPAGLSGFLNSLTADDQVRLVGPRGTTTPLAIADMDPVNHTVYQLTFAPQTYDGTYTLVLGPNALGINIHNFVDNGTFVNQGGLPGTPLDQNQNGIPGEYPADQFVAQLPINTSDDGLFVSGLYHDLLGRTADVGGFLNYLGVLDGARFGLLGSIANTFTLSGENLGNFVRRLFSSSDPLATSTYLLPFGNFLQRPASAADVSSWVNMMAQGLTEEQLMAALVSSQEYFVNRAGSSNATWVAKAYQDLLGRGTTGDPGAQAFVIALNGGGLNRAQVATALVNSLEFRTRLAKAVYGTLLGRVPPDVEINFWTSFLAQPAAAGGPTPDQRLVTAVLASQEYFYRAGNTNAAWLTSLYARLLGRTPDSAGYTNNLNFLMGSYQAQRQAVVVNLDHSPEYKAILVRGYYQTYLHRAATDAEVAAKVSAMLAGKSDESVIADVVSSDEYFQGLASGKNDQWLDHAYVDVLHRPRDLSSNAFLNGLNAGTLTLNLVATALLVSPEYRGNLIAKLYNTYLHRNKPVPPPAGDGEVGFWVGMMAKGFTDEDVLTAFLQTPEYFTLPHQYP